MYTLELVTFDVRKRLQPIRKTILNLNITRLHIPQKLSICKSPCSPLQNKLTKKQYLAVAYADKIVEKIIYNNMNIPVGKNLKRIVSNITLTVKLEISHNEL